MELINIFNVYWIHYKSFDSITILEQIKLQKELILMNKKIKYPVIIVFAVLYLVSDALGAKYLPGYAFFWTLISVLGALTIYFYNDSILIFSYINKKWNQWVKKPQVTWEIFHTVQTDDSKKFDTAKDKLFKMLSEKGSLNTLNDHHDQVIYEVEVPDIRRYSLNLLQLDNDVCEITISYKCTLSYKKSADELEHALKFFSTMTQHISVTEEENIYENKALYNPPIYKLLLSFTGMNPFYGLMTKKIDQKEIESFSLSFTQQSCSISIEDNDLTIVSPNPDDLSDVVENYLPLSELI